MHSPFTPESIANLRTLTFPVLGMSCSGCATRLQRALVEKEEISEALVNFASEQVTVSFHPSSLSASNIIQVVEEAGYEIPAITIDLKIEGMTCASCAARVEKALLSVNAVQEARVNVAAETAQVTVPQGLISVETLVSALEVSGYSASRVCSSKEKPFAEEKGERQRAQREFLTLLGSAVLTAPLVVPMIVAPFGLHVVLPGALQLALALPVQVIFGARFYRGAVKALRVKTANMDTLVALGTSAAFLLSLWNLGVSQNLYFESAAVIITLVRFGKWLEARAKRSTTRSIRALMDLRPDRARVERKGKEIDISVDAVVRGDTVIVRPGERLPVDGEIVEGQSQLDESLLTGESMPVSRTIGEGVIGGSINGEGLLRISATEVGESALLARIVALVHHAQGSKAPIQKLVDRIAAIFVPTVLCIALMTVVGWLLGGFSLEEAIVAAVSVLVIACPCALGLATPAALTVGTGIAARAGILIKDAEALERAQSIDTVIFDKTGTLTQGSPVVVQVLSEDPEKTLALAASVQRGSEHPLAEAIRRAATEREVVLLEISQFQAHRGRGVEAHIKGAKIFVGSPRFKREAGFEKSQFEGAARKCEEQGMTVVWVFDESQVFGAIALGDEPRDSSQAAVASLEQKGIETVLLTGDNRAAAEAVGAQLGIQHVFSEILPQGKASQVETLQSQDRVVAMVGDGVNDAPALATADVSFAMGSGSDVAMHAAGITLMRPEPTLVYDAIIISQATTKKIRQNLLWAFLYNIVGIPLAAFGFLTPMLAGAAMAASSVSVLSNALFLRLWKPSR